MAGQPMNAPQSGSECIHCGFCLETCPTYVLTGKEEESPRGRILLAHALLENRVSVERSTMAPLDHCLGCLACESACPSGVVYRDILFEVRYHADRVGHVRHPLEHFLLQHVIIHPSRLRVVVLLYRLLGVRGLVRALAKRSLLPKAWRERAELSPSFEPRSNRRPVTVDVPAGAPRAILLRGCAARVFMPATEDAMVHLLQRAGYHVDVWDRPRCCGALPHHAGMHELAESLGRQTVDALSRNNDSIIIATAAGCGAHLRELGSGKLAGRVRDLSQALLEAPNPLAFKPTTSRVVFQDPCHLRHAQGIVEEPRRLLRNAGARLVEAEEVELCCGSAGSYHLATPGLSAPLARRKRDVLLATKSDTVVTANPGCWMQLRAVWPENGPRLLTLARYLEEQLVTDSLPGPGRVHDHSSSSNPGTNAP